MDFEKLRRANVIRDKEWNGSDTALSLLFRAAELGGEAGEALNIMKKLERERLGIRGSKASLDDLMDELADVVICCDLSAMTVGRDLAEAVKNKFNKTSDKYGLTVRII